MIKEKDDLTLKRFNVNLGMNNKSRFIMKSEKKRATIYFDPDLYKTLRMKAAAVEDSISDLVNEAVRLSLREDDIDIRAYEERGNETLVSFEDVLKKLRMNGKI